MIRIHRLEGGGLFTYEFSIKQILRLVIMCRIWRHHRVLHTLIFLSLFLTNYYDRIYALRECSGWMRQVPLYHIHSELERCPY